MLKKLPLRKKLQSKLKGSQGSVIVSLSGKSDLSLDMVHRFLKLVPIVNPFITDQYIVQVLCNLASLLFFLVTEHTMHDCQASATDYSIP